MHQAVHPLGLLSDGSSCRVLAHTPPVPHGRSPCSILPQLCQAPLTTCASNRGHHCKHHAVLMCRSSSSRGVPSAAVGCPGSHNPMPRQHTATQQQLATLAAPPSRQQQSLTGSLQPLSSSSRLICRNSRTPGSSQQPGDSPNQPPPNSSSSGVSLGRFMFGGGDGSFSRPQSSSSSGDADNSSSSWALMGRVVQSDRLVIGSSPGQRLVLLAAARTAGVSEEEMLHRVKELITLLPDLSSLLFSLSPTTLAQLTADTAGVAQKLVQLRLWFPTADLAAMVSRRPTLLLEEHWVHVDGARLRLLARLLPPPASSQPVPAAPTPPTAAAAAEVSTRGPQDPTAVGAAGGVAYQGLKDQTSPLLDGLVSRQPLLLVANVDDLLDELARLLPSVDVLRALQQDPDLVTSIMCNRNLSIWLMPGVAVLPLLERNPGMLFSVQRGSAALGPGAEFMGQG